jgi:hypothetical protein
VLDRFGTPRERVPLAAPRATARQRTGGGVAAGDFPFAVDLAIVLMDVAVAVEDAVPGLREIVNAPGAFAVSELVR